VNTTSFASSTGTGAGVFQTSPTINTPTLATPTLTGTSTFAGGVANAYGFGVGTAVPSSGAGIAFPATQNPSSDANTLDDYEEGTWTPTDTSGAGLTFSVNSASYTKIGRMVFVNTYLTYPSTSNGTTAQIGGLPYQSQGGSNYSYIIGRTQSNIGNQIVWQVNTASTNLAANYGWNSVGTPTNANLSGSYILISGCYNASA
jgi:hypothetical protein